MKLDDIKQGLNSAWESVSGNLNRLLDSATGALTRFKPESNNALPEARQVDDPYFQTSSNWGLLAGNVFEDEQTIVVRLEIPGMEKENFEISVNGDLLYVSGEKRFEQEHTEGRYRTFQCAYGAFRRSVRLPAPVLAESAQASYRNGILRIALPKVTPAKPNVIHVTID